MSDIVWIIMAYLAGLATPWLAKEYRRSSGGRMVVRELRDRGPAPEMIHYEAWNTAVLVFARRTLRMQHISERVVTEVGIVQGVLEYRVMAEQMVRAGLWVKTGRGRKRRWVQDRAGAVQAFHQAMLKDKVVPSLAPYPTGLPPAIRGPRRA